MAPDYPDDLARQGMIDSAAADDAADSPTRLDHQLGLDLIEPERALVRELILAVRSIPYGTIVLTMHDSRLVEISKTVKLRRTK